MNDRLSSDKRLDYVDLSKALAIISVLLIHCSAGRFTLYEAGSLPWLTNAFWGTISRWAVPMFLMCSGALMNDPRRELSIKKLFSKYILHFVVVFTLWAGFYELIRIANALGDAPLRALIGLSMRNMVAGTTHYHLYYFYFVLALYLALPLTRIIAEHASEEQLRYILVLWFLAGAVLSFLQCYDGIAALIPTAFQYILPTIFLCPGLGLLGYCMGQHPTKRSIAPLGLFLLSFAVCYSMTWKRSVEAGGFDGFYLDAFNPFVLLMAVGVFGMAQRISLGPKTAKTVHLISSASFCIYLSHPFFQMIMMQDRFEALPPLWSVPFQAGLLLGISLILYLILKRIPVAKHWLI